MSRTFWFHYNKPESKKSGTPKLTVHYNRTCYVVDHIECEVPTKTHHRNKQPHCVLRGKCENFEIKDGKARLS